VPFAAQKCPSRPARGKVRETPAETRIRCLAVLSGEGLQQTAGVCKPLAHPSRLRMIQALAVDELCVCELARVTALSLSATSHQLHRLRSLGLVRSRSEGKLVFYSLQDATLPALVERCAAGPPRTALRP
jgi:DNA-binding transcriptional ArsR family regulator